MRATARARLLARLDAAIAASRQPVATACLRAERAVFLARQGRLDEARRAIDELQAQWSLRPQAAVSAWVALAEAMHGYFSDLGAGAHDKLLRAHALSAAAGLAPLQALAAAWLAHVDFDRRDDARMAQHVTQALTLAAPDHHSARSRACLVVSRGYHFAQRLDRAQPWYRQAREHALAEGDDAALSALMHNQAQLRATQARMAELFADDPAGDAADHGRHGLLGAESAGHYDANAGTNALAVLGPLLRAHLLVVHERHAEAAALFEAHLAEGERRGLAPWQPGYLADLAWCRLKLGDRDGARTIAEQVQDQVARVRDIDDRALAEARLARVFEALGDADAAARHADHARKDWRAHCAERDRIVALLDEALAPLGEGPGA